MKPTFPCPRCGARNAINQRFCTFCGGKIEYRCARCGASTNPTLRFCPYCRAELSWGKGHNLGWIPQRAGQTATSTDSQPPPSKSFTTFALIILLLGIGAFGYWAFGSYEWESAASSTGFRFSENNIAGLEPGCLPCVKASGEPVYLVDNPNARDVSYDELKSFILEDDTDNQVYIPKVRMCGCFAEEVHNNAERAGIRAAFVIIEFEGNSAPHALNAFRTTDKGLVYIDCTGIRKSSIALEEWLNNLVRPVGCDRLGYVEAGKAYGAINLDQAESLEYSFYAGYAQSWTILADTCNRPASIVKNVKIYW